GLQVAAFHKAVCEFLGVDRLVLTNSCTSALTLALKLAGVEPGAAVVTTPMTCVATNTPIKNLGGEIVWADIDPNTASIDPGDVDKHVLARKLKWFGYDRDAHKDAKGEWKGQNWSADIEPGEVGYKFNMNNIAAAIGLSQMPHLQRILDAHRRNAAAYNEAFANCGTIRPLAVPDEAASSFWVYTALVGDDEVDRDALIARLNAEGISAGL